MRIARMLVALGVLVASAACSNGPAAPGGATAAGGSLGINRGAPTGAGSYGSVGALLYDFDQNGIINANDQLCTGSLISPTVVLTAGHCLSFLPAGAIIHVSFAPDLSANLNTITATGFAIDPAYGHDQSDPIDVGVVLVPAGSTTGLTPLTLPPAGLLDTLSAQNGLKDQRFINVGYGLDATSSGHPAFSYDGQRRFSISEFKGLQKAWLSLAMNTSATGEGGDCYGDSGGPKFMVGNASMIVGTVSWGDTNCRALSKNYRLDTEPARAFLSRFVQLP